MKTRITDEHGVATDPQAQPGNPAGTPLECLRSSLVLLAPLESELVEFYNSLVFNDAEGGETWDRCILADDFSKHDQAPSETRWAVRFQMNDLDAAVAKAETLGGHVARHGDEVLVRAPDGSEFLLSAIPGNPPAIQTMYELCTADLAGSGNFYCTLLGLRRIAIPDDPHRYEVLVNGSGPVAGAVDMASFFSASTPAQWIPYFHVGDLDNGISLAVDYGALVKVPPTMSAFSVRYAVLTDPVGATFGLREIPVDGIFGDAPTWQTP